MTLVVEDNQLTKGHKIILKCNRTDAKNVEGRKEEEQVKEDKYGK